MKRIVIIAAIIGFTIPGFWGISSFLFFNMKESATSEIFWKAVYITCPFWILPGLWGTIAMPILNGALYGGVGFLAGLITKRT